MDSRSADVRLWHIDQHINDYGVCIDMDFVRAAAQSVEEIKAYLADETKELTGYDEENGEGLASTTQRDKMLKYLLAEHGVSLPDMRASTLERRLNDENLPEGVRVLIAIRLEASQSSVTKYKRLLKSISSDGRLRGLLQFSGAPRTRRDSGRTFQPQNLVRPPKYLAKDWEGAIDAIKRGAVDLLYSKPMEVLGGTMRGVIVAPSGRKLVVADLANIEGRVAAWLAGEEWKLQAFRDYDTVMGKDGSWYTAPEYYKLALYHAEPALETDGKGEPIRKGHDLYKLSFAKSFGISPEDVSDENRQIGKVQELALQYLGSLGAFVNFATIYGIDLEKMADNAWDTLSLSVRDDAEGYYEWMLSKKRPTFGLSKKAVIVCLAFVNMWRAAHPAIAGKKQKGDYFAQGGLWRNLEDGAKNVIQGRCKKAVAGKLEVDKVKAWLRIKLPSGRYLCYPGAKLTDEGKITYKGINQYTRKWEDINTYSGKLLENATQSVSRDVMFDNIPGIIDAGYDMTLRVHDEVVNEADLDSELNPAHLSALLARNSPWCSDLPLAAAGWEGPRYRKG